MAPMGAPFRATTGGAIGAPPIGAPPTRPSSSSAPSLPATQAMEAFPVPSASSSGPHDSFPGFSSQPGQPAPGSTSGMQPFPAPTAASTSRRPTSAPPAASAPGQHMAWAAPPTSDTPAPKPRNNRMDSFRRARRAGGPRRRRGRGQLDDVERPRAVDRHHQLASAGPPGREARSGRRSDPGSRRSGGRRSGGRCSGGRCARSAAHAGSDARRGRSCARSGYADPGGSDGRCRQPGQRPPPPPSPSHRADRGDHGRPHGSACRRRDAHDDDPPHRPSAPPRHHHDHRSRGRQQRPRVLTDSPLLRSGGPRGPATPPPPPASTPPARRPAPAGRPASRDRA